MTVRSNRGQILPLALVSVLLLALLWVMLLNVGKLIKDRIQMQIAADTAVQTACAYRARGLNIIGVLNSWLGVPVFGIGTPLTSWWAAPGHEMDQDVVKQSVSDLKKAAEEMQKFATSNSQVQGERILTGILRGLMMMIDFCYDTHPDAQPNFAQKQKNFIEAVIQVQENYLKSYGGGWAKFKAQEIAQAQGADDIYIPKGLLSLGLNRNKGLIWYLSTLHVWYAAYPEYPVVIAPFTPINDDEGPTKRWLEQSPTFYRQSVRLYAFRRPDSKFNGPFPLGGSLFDVQMPYLYSAAAARVYNPDGPMFPTHDEGDGFFGGMSAGREYSRASNGWHTQLVPIGGLYDH
jgi:hypothetical protein